MVRRGITILLVLTVSLLCLMNIFQSLTMLKISSINTDILHINDELRKYSVNQTLLKGSNAATLHQYPVRMRHSHLTLHTEHNTADVDHNENRHFPLMEPWIATNRSDYNEEFDPKSRGCSGTTTSTLYKYISNIKVRIPSWQQQLETCGRLGHLSSENWKYKLTLALQVRIYTSDKAKWTIKELKQWLHYMFLSGVEHVYICDHYANESEKLDIPLRRYIDSGLVTYIEWASNRNPMKSQIKCYQYIIDNYKNMTEWQMAIDMDEYPFSPIDHREGFLIRYLDKISAKKGPKLAEISMSNYHMLGQGDRSRDMVIDRINRINSRLDNGLVKPIYRPQLVSAGVHHFVNKKGFRITADSKQLKMLHYWGARGQNWGPDTNKTISITEIMNAMRDKWAGRVKNSLLVFGEYEAFSNSTGP